MAKLDVNEYLSPKAIIAAKKQYNEVCVLQARLDLKYLNSEINGDRSPEAMRKMIHGYNEFGANITTPWVLEGNVNELIMYHIRQLYLDFTGAVVSNVTITSSEGIYGGTYNYAGTEVHKAPTVDALDIIGTLQEGQMLLAVASGFYSYTGRLEGTHTYEWFTVDDYTGTNKTSVGTGLTYTVQAGDVDKHLIVEMVIKEIGGTVDGFMTTIISDPILDLPYNNFSVGVVENEATSTLYVGMDNDITALTDESGWSVSTGGSNNVITAISYVGNTVELTLTSAVTNGQAVTVSYSQGSGNMDVNNIAAGSFTNETCRNSVGETFSTKVQFNNDGFNGGHGIGGNWNDYTGNPELIGVWLSNMNDSAGSATAIDIELTEAGIGWTNGGSDTANTTEFPAPAFATATTNWTNTGNIPTLTYKISGFTANAWVKVWIGTMQANTTGTAHFEVGGITTQVANVVTSLETAHSVQADSNGDIWVTHGVASNNCTIGLAAMVFEF